MYNRNAVFEPGTFGILKLSAGLTQLDFLFQEFRISQSGGRRALTPEKEYFLFLFSHMQFHSVKSLPHASFFIPCIFHLIKRAVRWFSTVPVFPCRCVFVQGFFSIIIVLLSPGLKYSKRNTNETHQFHESHIQVP